MSTAAAREGISVDARSEDGKNGTQDGSEDVSGSDQSSDSSGDESGDEDDLKQYISLNLGQTLTSLVLPYRRGNQASPRGLDDRTLARNLSASCLSNVHSRQRSFSQTHSTSRNDIESRYAKRYTISSHGRNGFQMLDDIQLNNNYEYGFNPERDYNNSRKLFRQSRPSSLYTDSNKPLFTAPEFLIDQGCLRLDNKDVDSAVSNGQVGNASFVSLARNEEESTLEQELHRLKRRPSQLMFHPSSNSCGSPRPNPSRIRRGIPRRQLSFDSQLTQQASLALSSCSAESCDVLCRSNKDEVQKDLLLRNNFASSTELSDVDVTKSPNSFSRPRHGLKLDLSLLNSSKDFQATPVAAPPPAAFTERVEVDRLVGADERDTNPSPEKGKQQGLHDLLNAFKLPYRRTVGRLRRKSQDDKSKAVARASDVSDPSATQYPTCHRSAPTTPECSKLFEGHQHLLHSSSTNIISQSTCSLPRVDEGKETFSFDSGLTRKACSSCSIAYRKDGSPTHEHEKLERRLSDTALQHDRSLGCSPRKTLVRRLLSPVVCGASNDKYMMFGMSSSHSLNSDCSSIGSDEDYQPLNFLIDSNLQDVAEQLCLIDKELIIRIPWNELATCGWMSKNKYVRSPNVMNNVEFFNRVAMLITSCILSEIYASHRAKVITKAIKLAKRCRELKNYNSLRAILGGLQCTPIYRLKHTWKLVPTRTKRLFKDLSSLMDNENNFSAYRKELGASLAEPPCLPFLGDFFTQIAHAVAYSSARERFEAQYDSDSTSPVVNRKFPVTNATIGKMRSGGVSDQTVLMRGIERDGPSSCANADSNDNVSSAAESSHKRHSRNDSDDSGVIVLKSACETPEFDETDAVSPTPNIAMDDNQPSTHDELLQPNNKNSHRKRSFRCFDNNGFTKVNAGNLYAKEYEFWRYQIAAIQYRFPVKTDVRSFLANSPFRSEEENYRISLLREKPAKPHTT